MSNSVRITVSGLHELHFLMSALCLTAHISPLPKCPRRGNVFNILHRIALIYSTPPSVSLTAVMRPEMKRMLINTAAFCIYLKISITPNCNHSSISVMTLSQQTMLKRRRFRQQLRGTKKKINSPFCNTLFLKQSKTDCVPSIHLPGS